jgi:hypothetical protein
VKEFYTAVAARLPPEVVLHNFTAQLSDPPVAADYPYVVLGGGPGWDFSGDGPESPSLAAVVDSVEMRIKATLAATSLTGLDWLFTRVRPALSGQRLSVQGWSCSAMEQTPLLDIQPDRAISFDGLNPLFMVDEYTFIATRI